MPKAIQRLPALLSERPWSLAKVIVRVNSPERRDEFDESRGALRDVQRELGALPTLTDSERDWARRIRTDDIVAVYGLDLERRCDGRVFADNDGTNM